MKRHFLYKRPLAVEDAEVRNAPESRLAAAGFALAVGRVQFERRTFAKADCIVEPNFGLGVERVRLAGGPDAHRRSTGGITFARVLFLGVARNAAVLSGVRQGNFLWFCTIGTKFAINRKIYRN